MTPAEIAELEMSNPDTIEKLERHGGDLETTAAVKSDPSKAHAKLSASGSSRWINCPGSVKAESDYPYEPSSVYAMYGTAAHHLAEVCLKDGSSCPEDYVGNFIIAKDGEAERIVCGEELSVADSAYSIDENTFEITQEFADHVNSFVQLVRDIVATEDGALMVEIRVNFSDWVPGGFGTSDVIILSNRGIRIIDLKFGTGVKVMAQGNTQLMLYALGVVNDLGSLLNGDENIIVAVHQPRLDHFDEWEISTKDLIHWADTVAHPAAMLALTYDAPRFPGESQCRFCRDFGRCRAAAHHALEVACDGFTIIDEDLPSKFKDHDRLTPEERGALMDHRKFFKSWIGAAEDSTKADIEAGVHIPGWKMVAGRGSRDWEDKERAERALRRELGAAEAYKPREILTPAAAEKKIGKEHRIIKKFVVKKAGAPTVAPESDKRPAIIIDHSEDFATN